MDLLTRIEVVQCYYASCRSPTSAYRLFKQQRGLIKDPFFNTTVTRLIAKFEETSSVTDKPR